MANFIILAQSEITANAISAWMELLVGEKPITGNNPQRIVWKASTIGKGESGVLDYEQLVRRIEDATRDATNAILLNEVVVLVDSINPTPLKFSPLRHATDWDNLLAMLILTFPEICWFFGVIPPSTADSKLIIEHHSFPSLLSKPRRDTLFDATGLRNSIRLNLGDSLFSKEEKDKSPNNKIDEKSIQKRIPIRVAKAAAIDEETSYSLFHAYTAYRFGYRAEPVRTWAQMNHLFGKTALQPHGFQLLLEDVNLNFPDKDIEIHLSTFAKIDSDGIPGRASNCHLLADDTTLENSAFRIIVTSGHSGDNGNTINTNLAYVEGYKGRKKSGYVLKPVGGMFDLWKQAKLFKRLPRRYDEAGQLLRQGHAPGFYWPPFPMNLAKNSGGHSAPGKLMLIAQHLVRRADALVESASTVEECIRGAVFATDALELLRFQTPTLALQALSLKHEFEVKAEVAFLGVGHHFLLDPRLREMQRDVKVASQYFEKGRRKAAELDTLVSIGNRLVLIFRKAGQFDEESACLIQVRKWHRELQRRQTQDPFTLAGHCVMTYVEWLLISPRHFILAFVGWYLLLAVLWYVLQPFPFKTDEISAFWFALSVSFNTFVAASPEKAVNISSYILNGLGLTSGLFHLGVFIAYLYSIISRK